MLTSALIIGSILADLGLGAAAYKATKELKRMADGFNTRLVALENSNVVLRDRVGFSYPLTTAIPLSPDFYTEVKPG